MPPKIDRKAPSYLAFMREQECCWCRRPGPSDPHHFGKRGTGQKADDYHTVPLCRACHEYFHARGTFRGAMREEAALRIWHVQAVLMATWMRLEPLKMLTYSVERLSDEKLGCVAKSAALSFGEFAGDRGDEAFVEWGRRLQALLGQDGMMIVEVR